MNPDYIEKLNNILLEYFYDNGYLPINASMECLPLVAANISKSTSSFSLGQLVYVYNIYFGMNDRAEVVARYRRRNRLIRGTLPINSLINCRPKLVYKPAVICKLNGYYIDGGIFMRLLDVPNEFTTLDQYMIAIKEKSQAT